MSNVERQLRSKVSRNYGVNLVDSYDNKRGSTSYEDPQTYDFSRTSNKKQKKNKKARVQHQSLRGQSQRTRQTRTRYIRSIVRTGSKSGRKGTRYRYTSTRNRPRYRTNRPIKIKQIPGLSLLQTKQVKGFRRTLKTAKTKHSVSLNRRVGYDLPMPFLQPTQHNTRNKDQIRVSGSEFLTTITVNDSTSGSSATTAGDLLYFIAINPSNLPGTRLQQLCRLYQKYKFLTLVAEAVPIVSAMQGGAMSMYFTEDVNENPTVPTDPDTRQRIIMAHEGANMFNVISYGRCFYHSTHDSQEWYYLQDTDEPRLNNQGQLFIHANSEFVPSVDTGNTEITLCQIIIHYDLLLAARTFDEEVTGPISGDVDFDGIYTDYFTNNTTTGQTISLLNTSIPAFSEKLYYVTVQRAFTLNGNPLTVNTEDVDGIPLFSKGSAWYLACDFTGTNCKIYLNIDDALSKSGGVTLTTNITGSHSVGGLITYRAVPRSINMDN